MIALFNQTPKRNAGYLLVMVLVFASIFLFIISSFVGYVVTQNQVVNFRFEQQRATEIAESGLNYYKWFLAHYPGDFTNGTGLPGPYVQTYRDPEGTDIGEFSLEVASSTYCGNVASVEITSTGFTYQDPTAVAVVSARYTRPTVAEYSFINNAGVWFGDSRVITGPVHGNQGVKMDGFHNSTVGSGQATFDCTGSFGCTPTVNDVDGVFTASGNASPGLFEFPVSPIDFAGLTIDLTTMKTNAQNAGIYYGPTGGFGYRLVFNGDETVDVFRVTNTNSYWAYSADEGWHQGERNDITGQTQIANNLPVSPECPVLFFEDKLWIEGVVSQKLAVGAALNTVDPQTNIVIHNNVTYAPGSNAGLLAIAQDDIDIGIDVPNNMIANGIYIAQNGRFGRNHYCQNDCSGTSGNQGLPSVLDAYVSRDSLTRLGSVVSNLRVGTEWSNGSGNHISGFRSRITSFDRDQVDNPPPLTPETSDVYEFKDWRQEG